MNKKSGIIAIVIAVIALCLSVVSLTVALKPAAAPAETPVEAPAETSDKDIQYVLYLGTNDKDTNEPVFEPEEAKAKAEEVLINHFGGYTVQEANGGWIDGDTLYQEYTIVIYLSDTSIEDVHAACDELIQVFNQSSVLIQANETTTEFYSNN